MDEIDPKLTEGEVIKFMEKLGFEVYDDLENGIIFSHKMQLHTFGFKRKEIDIYRLVDLVKILMNWAYRHGHKENKRRVERFYRQLMNDMKEEEEENLPIYFVEDLTKHLW